MSSPENEASAMSADEIDPIPVNLLRPQGAEEVVQRRLQGMVLRAAARVFEDGHGQKLLSKNEFTVRISVGDGGKLRVVRYDAADAIDVDRPDRTEAIRRFITEALTILVDSVREVMPQTDWRKVWPPLLERPEIYVRREAYKLGLLISMRVGVPTDGVASDSDQAEHRRRLFKVRVGERALEAVAAETVAPVAISIQEAKPAYSDLNLVDELLCDMATLLCNALPPTHEAWAKVENYSSITRCAMARLRQAWVAEEMLWISAGLAAYFRKTGTEGSPD